MVSRIRKYIAFFLTAAVALTIVAGFPFPARLSADTTAPNGYFPTAAEEISQINAGWNLGNTLDANGNWINGSSPSSFETAWGNPVTTREMIAAVHDRGFNSIRIPVTWAQHIDASGNVDSAWMARVREVVDYAYDLGMYVILNVHHDTGEHGSEKVCWIIAEEGSVNSILDKYRNLWTNIANEFSDYDYRLMFEGYNELLDTNNTWNAPSIGQSAYNAVNTLAQTFVDAVRATGGNNASRNLIVNTYVASIDQDVLNNFTLPSDTTPNHLAAQVHIYAPWGFTGTSASVNWTPVHSDFTDLDRAEIDGVMSAISAFSSRIGVPVIIGECGAEYKNNDEAIAQYAGYLFGAATANNIKCFWWDNGIYGTGASEGGYAILNRSTLQWKENIVSAILDNVTAASPEYTEADETSEETVTPEETEIAEETATVEETSETAAAEESSASVSGTEDESSDTVPSSVVTDDGNCAGEDADESGGWVKPVIITATVIVILGTYVGLFMLGRHHRRTRG